MENEQNTVVENVETMDNDYINTINQLKANRVPKEEYDKVLQQNRQLLDSLANGKKVEEEEKVVKRPLNEIRDELFNKEHTNLEYAKLSLELRDRVLEENNEDIFVASNSVYTPSADSYEASARVAQVMKECVEYANGDSQVFTNELMRRTNDINLPNRR